MSQHIWFTTMLAKLPPDVLEEWDERSGILQYDAGFSRVPGDNSCLNNAAAAPLG
jgi:hypothetical protein